MIYDTLSRILQYQGIHHGVMKGLSFLANTDFDLLIDGHFELDGENLFANIMSYHTRLRNDTPETHKKYIDIQFLISGQELVRVAPVEEMSGIAEARPQGDIWLHRGSGEALTLTGDRFLVLWPGDAHAPGIAADGIPAPVRKCVVKVKL